MTPDVVAETAVDVSQSGDVLTELTDIKQLLTFIVVVLVLAIAFFLFKRVTTLLTSFFLVETLRCAGVCWRISSQH